MTNVGPTSFTVQWNVSINLRGLGRYSILILDSLPFQRYNFSSGFYRRGYQIRYIDSRGISRLRTISTFSSIRAPANQYTITSLRFGETYNVSVRAQIRVISSCYSYLYGQYSDDVIVETVETGNLISNY